MENKIRVGINGMGRIGRQVFRIMRQPENRSIFSIVAVHGTAPAKDIAMMIKYDTVYGRYNGSIQAEDGMLIVDGEIIKCISDRSAPHEISWGGDIDVVIESTGAFRTKSTIKKPGYDGHIGRNGCKKVILTFPAKDKPDATVVLGVNNESLSSDSQCISLSSCTTNCLAPMAKVLDDVFGIESGMFTTIHSMTNDQRVCDSSHSDLRRARSAAHNIIPTSTGAARGVTSVMPQLEGKLNGTSMRVPVITGSCVDFTVNTKSIVTVESINSAMKTAADFNMKGILFYTEEPIVSSDIVQDTHSCIFDAQNTMVLGNHQVKVVGWYDNEWGYSARVVELAKRSMETVLRELPFDESVIKKRRKYCDSMDGSVSSEGTISQSIMLDLEEV